MSSEQQTVSLVDLEEKLSSSYTPDISDMEQKETALFFCWCDMQTGLRRHSLLAPFVQKGPYPAFSADKNYHLFKRRLGRASSPVLIQGDRQAKPEDSVLFSEKRLADQPARVRGEVYLVNNPAEVFLELDKKFVNGYQYDRRRINVYLPFTTFVVGEPGYRTKLERKRTVEAYAYVGRRDYWDIEIDGGLLYEPCRVVDRTNDPSYPPDIHKIIRFFYFDKNDYNTPRQTK